MVLYGSLLQSIFQRCTASLLAIAVIALFGWPVFLVILWKVCFALWSLATQTHAAWIRVDLSCGLPVFEIGPFMRVLPLCEIVGARPMYFASCEEFLNLLGLNTSAANIVAVVGPTPGCDCSILIFLAFVFLLNVSVTFFSMSLIFCLRNSYSFMSMSRLKRSWLSSLISFNSSMDAFEKLFRPFGCGMEYCSRKDLIWSFVCLSLFTNCDRSLGSWRSASCVLVGIATGLRNLFVEASSASSLASRRSVLLSLADC